MKVSSFVLRRSPSRDSVSTVFPTSLGTLLCSAQTLCVEALVCQAANEISGVAVRSFICLQLVRSVEDLSLWMLTAAFFILVW